MSHDVLSEPDELVELVELIRGAAALAPLIAPPAWAAAESPRPGLSFGAPADRAAWIQLGATIEAIDVAGSATGLAFSVDPYTSALPLPVTASATTMSMTAHRLAACLRRPPGSFRPAPLRLASHVSARLASAAALHGCTLAWFESSSVLAELAAALARPDLPAGASAVGVISTPREERGDLMRGGRAACRVWLEAVSLGLAVQPMPSISTAISTATSTAPLASLDLRIEGALVAALSFGAAA